MHSSKYQPIGALLVERGALREADLERALVQQDGRLIGETLIDMNMCSTGDVVAALANQLDLGVVDARSIAPTADALAIVPARFAFHYQVVPVRVEDGALVLAMADPHDVAKRHELCLLLGRDIRPVVCSRDDVKHGLKEFYGLGAEMADAIVRARGSNSDPMGTESTTIDGDDRQEARTVVQFVNTVLVEAYRRNATDVHIEPLDHDVRVRFRIDGMLQPVKTPGSARQFRDAIVSRIKVMAGLDIAEKRIPQDGRISVTVAGEELDLRVSVLPSIFGEAVDIRLLNSATHFLDLHQLGIARADLETLEGVIRKPHGIVLLTGPTGSGKTTTLYAALKRIRSDDIKIITIEDPVEYRLPGITQIQINPEAGLTFAGGLRSMLRHDPDVMMVGEIRDEQTAQIATRVALTGHLVFSTLHTNDAASAVTRLADMGIERYLVASTLECVVAQRLVRVICDECKGRRSLRGVTPPASYGVVELPEAVWQGAGCDRCLHTGYRGRVAIYEMLLLDDDLRGLVARTAEAAEIKAVARSRGMRTMMEHGVELVASGVTTLEELFRVTQADPVRR